MTRDEAGFGAGQAARVEPAHEMIRIVGKGAHVAGADVEKMVRPGRPTDYSVSGATGRRSIRVALGPA